MFGKKKSSDDGEQARPPFQRPRGWTGETRKRPLEFSDHDIREYEIRDVSGRTSWTSNTPADHPIMTYFDAFESLNLAQRERRFEDAFRIAESHLDGFVALMRQDIGDYGRICISSSPHFFYLLEHLPYRDPPEAAISAMEAVRARVSDPPMLAAWCAPMFDEALERQRLWRRVREHLKTNPGAIQSTLGKTIGADQKAVASVIREATERNLIRREPEKKSYRLFVA